MVLRAGFHGTVGQPSAQVIDGCLKFNRSGSNYLKKTISTTGNQKTFTVSGWFKKCLIDTTQYLFTTEYLGSGNYFEITMLSGRTLQVYNNKATTVNVKLSRFLRDNGWFHVTVAVDTTIASPAEDRVKIYINGERQTDFDSSGGGDAFPTQDYTFELSNSRDWLIGAVEFSNSVSSHYDGYMSQFYFIDGQALDASNFGFTDELTGTWRPKKYTDTYGTNGFYLPMDGNSPIGQDKSGNGNDWTPVNFSGTFNDPDVLKDSPSGAVFGGPPTSGITTTSSAPSNYATFNVLRERTGGYNPTFSDGNLFMDGRGDGTGTLSASSGKFYFEVLVDTVTTSGQIYLGVQDAAYPGTERAWSTAQIAAMRDTNTLYGDGSTGSGTTYGAGDLMSFAFDVDNNKLYIAKNGVYMNGGNPSQGTGFTHSGISFVGGYTPIVSDSQTGQKFRANFGQKPFKYTPPDGFQPLNAANIRPETVITRPDQYVGVATYRGNSQVPSAGGNLIKLSMQPDLVWIKNRFGTSNSYILTDSVRGANNSLFSNTDEAQSSVTHGVDFRRNGFITSGSNDAYNNSAEDYVAWCWKAGGNKGTYNIDDVSYASASDAGFNPQATEIAPDSASISTKAGFSIVKYTGSGNDGDGVLHGLSQKPDLVIVKNINRAGTGWPVWQSGWNANENLLLGTNGSQDLGSPVDGYVGGHTSSNTSITMSNGSTGADYVNRISDKYIMYSWHNVPGLQKFGSFNGNTHPDGPFIELGFRPAIIWVKRISGAGNDWVVQDSERQKYNPVSNYLLLNSAANYGTGLDVDFLSNGFKIRNTNANMNTSTTYIYCAWAESPSVNLYGAQSNGR